MSAHPLSAVPSVTSLKVDDYDPLLSAIVEHERLARFKGFTADNAFELGTAIRSLFLERYAGKEVGIVIRIQLFGGHNLFGCVVGDAPAVNKSNWNWARGKANTVLTMHKSSLRVGRELARAGKTPESAQLPFPEFACHGGGFPLWIQGVDAAPIGVILVSGLPQLEDHQLIVSLILCSVAGALGTAGSASIFVGSDSGRTEAGDTPLSEGAAKPSGILQRSAGGGTLNRPELTPGRRNRPNISPPCIKQSGPIIKHT